MRRNDREIKDVGAIEAFISKENIIRIAFYDNGDIYIVPVNYGYNNDNACRTFYFHGAKAGRKYELAKTSPKVGFEIDGNYELIENEIACRYSAKFQSVIGTGVIELVEDKDEKITGLDCMMKQASGRQNCCYDDKTLEGVAVFRLKADKMTCKAK